MAAAGPAAQAGFGAAGSLLQGNMEANSLNAQAQVAYNNAELAREKGQYDSARLNVMATKKIGEETADYGASGVSTTSGSPLAILQESARGQTMDTLNILHGADVKAINYENQASLDKMGAESAIQGSYYNALANIGLGGTKAFTQNTGASPSGDQTVGSEGDMPGDEGESFDEAGGGEAFEGGEGAAAFA